MKIEIKANFDFGKMANALPKVIDKFLTESYADVVAEDSRKFIKSGQVLPELEPATIKRRERNNPPITGTDPLDATGALVKSIQKSKDGLRMKSYGTLHQEGFKNVPARPFLQVNNLSKIESKFHNALRVARKK